MPENNEKQSGLLVCRVACPDPQGAQRAGFSGILAAFSEAAGRLLCRLGFHLWAYPEHGAGALRVCPRCIKRQSLVLRNEEFTWWDY